MTTTLAARACSKCGRAMTEAERPRNGRYALGYCVECNRAKKRRDYANRRLETRKKQNAYHKIMWAKLRTEVLSAYGGRCACCGEDEMDFLCIDHVNGGGRQHRAAIGSRLYAVIRREGYPDTYQVLCFNCNHAKEREGGCPHKGKVQR